jgi:hypothetical protein
MGVSQSSSRRRLRGPARDMQDGAPMLDSSSRLPRVAPVALPANEWEEATFTRPMRSPFAAEDREIRDTIRDHAPRVRGPEVDVALEESALFETSEKMPVARVALRRVATAPPPRRSLTPAPLDEEATSQGKVNPELIRAIADRDSQRMRQAIRAVEALDLAKTTEEPALDVCDEALDTLLFRRS